MASHYCSTWNSPMTSNTVHPFLCLLAMFYKVISLINQFPYLGILWVLCTLWVWVLYWIHILQTLPIRFLLSFFDNVLSRRESLIIWVPFIYISSMYSIFFLSFLQLYILYYVRNTCWANIWKGVGLYFISLFLCSIELLLVVFQCTLYHIRIFLL